MPAHMIDYKRHVLLAWAMALVALGLVASAAGQTITEFPGAITPLRITAGPDGNLWFTEVDLGPGIGRITPEGVITEFTIPSHNAGPLQITTGPDGNLWFAESHVNRIGRVTTSGSFTEFPLPSTDSHPHGIAAGPDGALWFTHGDKIGRITTTGVITEFAIPTPGGLAAIVVGPDGALWFTESRANKIGRITTSGAISEFPLPTPGSVPIFITAGPDGALWFGESSANKIGRIETSGAITEFPIPTPGSNPQGIALGPDGAIWFAEYGANKIGRLSIGAPTCEPDATTMCLNAGRFRVTADWRTPDGDTGQGHAIPLTADTGYFWFFNQDNIEIVVKVLNACVDPFNAYWVFSAGLTNVEVTIRVVDTQTGSVKTYFNALNTPYGPVQDTSAFATCP